MLIDNPFISEDLSIRTGIDWLNPWWFVYVKSNLSEPIVSMSKLLRMKPGDTLNVNVDEKVDFYVEDQKYFKAEMGELKGNASIKLSKRIN